MTGLKADTAPGKSGLDKNVLAWFIEYFPNVLLEAFNFLLSNPDWENSMHSAYLKRRKIVFLPKKGKDPTRVENYRPISLLEVIYKLISKFLIEEIQDGVFRTASPNQFGFIPTRLMSNCSLTLLALIK